MATQFELLTRLMEYKKKDAKNKSDSQLNTDGACYGIALFYGYCTLIKNLPLYYNLENALNNWDGKTFPVFAIEKYFEILETLQYIQDHKIVSTTFFDAPGKINYLRTEEQRPLRAEFKDAFLYPRSYAKGLLQEYLTMNMNKLCLLTSGDHAIWVSSEFRDGQTIYLVMDPNVGLKTDKNGTKKPEEFDDFNKYFDYVVQQLLILPNSNIPNLIPLTMHCYDLDDIYIPIPKYFDMKQFHQDAIDELKKYPKGINSRSEQNQRSALDLACQINDKETVALLLKNGADPKSKFVQTDGSVQICLANAVMDGFSDVVNLLLWAGADITCSDGKKNNFHIAVKNNKNETYNVLLYHNTALANFGETCVNLLDLTSDGENLLHLAAEYGNTEVAKVLISSNKFNLRAKTKDNDSALGLAIKNLHVEIIELLLRKDEGLAFQSENGFSMLVLAVYHNLPSVVALILKIMLKYDATTLNYNYQKDVRALKFAIDNNEKIFSSLEKTKKFNVNIKFKDTLNTLLHYAAEKGATHVVELLISLKLDVQEINAKGETPIYLAGMNGHSEVFISLLEAGATITETALSEIIYQCAKNNLTSMLNVILKEEEFFEKDTKDAAFISALRLSISNNNSDDNLDTLLCYVDDQNIDAVLSIKDVAKENNCVEYFEIINEFPQTAERELLETIINPPTPQFFVDDIENPQSTTEDLSLDGNGIEDFNSDPTDLSSIYAQIDYLSGKRPGSSRYKRARVDSPNFWQKNVNSLNGTSTNVKVDTDLQEANTGTFSTSKVSPGQ